MKKFLFVSAAVISTATAVLPSAPAHANLWVGTEKTGSCYIPNRQTTFGCQFGTYRVPNGARQIGGFYVNPRHQFGTPGIIPIQYRVNGGNWVTRNLTLNVTRGNYVDFGAGVKSFDFRFLRPQAEDLGGGTITHFKFNYDLDR